MEKRQLTEALLGSMRITMSVIEGCYTSETLGVLRRDQVEDNVSILVDTMLKKINQYKEEIKPNGN